MIRVFVSKKGCNDKNDKDFIDQKWVDQQKHGLIELIVFLRVDVSWLRIKAR